MGLLDQLSNLSPEQTQGLLAAASQLLQAGGPSRMPTSFGQALGGGLTAYQNSTIEADKRKRQEEQDQQMAQLRGLNIQNLQGDVQAEQAKRERAAKLQQFFASQQQPQNPTAQAQSILGSNMSPTMENSARMQAGLQQQQPTGQQDEYSRLMSEAQALRAAGFAPEAEQRALEALKFRPEFDQTPRTGNDASGKPYQFVLDKLGNEKRLNSLPRDEMKLSDLGGRMQAYNPYALQPGQSFAKTATPGEMMSNSLGRERFNFEKSQAEDTATAPQYMDTSQGLMALPKRLKAGQAPMGQLVAGPDGKPLEKKQNIPQYVVEGITGNAKSLASIDAALASLKTPVGKNAVGWKGYLPNSILNRSDPEGTSTRANISDVGSLILHDRSGASVTAAESPRLMPFIPLTTDDDVTAAKKLKRFRELIQAETNNFTFQYPGAKALADFSAGGQGASGDTSVRKYNPATGKIE